MDIILPKKNGFEVLKELKASAETKAIPVIVLTNLSQMGDIGKIMELGGDDLSGEKRPEFERYFGDVVEKTLGGAAKL